ncbi:MAG: hypothetical protein ABI689_12305 [Thermoanaerobaculia bacterium]
MQEEDTRARFPADGRIERALGVAPWVLIAFLIAAAIVLLVLVSVNREFQVDEVEHIHTAYNLRDGRLIYRDFVQVHPPLLYVLLYPFVDPDDPVSSYRLARVFSATVLLATIGLLAWCAHRLAGRRAATVAAGLALFQTTLIERGIEVRGDGLLALLVMAALASELSPRPRAGVWRFAFQGLMLGLGLLVTLKALFPLALFGLHWLWTAARRRRLDAVLLPIAACFLPLLVTVALTLHFGNLREFVQQSLLDAGSAGLGAKERATFSPLPYLIHEGRRNLAFFVIVLCAVAIELRALRSSGASTSERRFVLWLSAGLFASLWANPFPWPYVQVTVLPFLVVLAATAMVRFVDEHAGRMNVSLVRWLPAIALLLVALTATPRLAAKSLPATSAQLDTLREVQRVSAPDDRFFDLAGLYFRPDAYPVFAMSGDLFRWYTLGRFPPIPDTLRANEAVGIILNYRVSWLRPHERQFVRERFVHYTGNILLLGRNLVRAPVGVDFEFEALKGKRFRFDGEGVLRIDGSPFVEGMLTKGPHRIRVQALAGPGRLILASAPPDVAAAEPVDLFVPFD